MAVDLEKLPPVAGATLLRQLGVAGPETELQSESDEFGGHGLALSLLGTYLRDVCEGDVRRRKEVAILDEEVEQGRHARRVMASYEAWLGGETSECPETLDAIWVLTPQIMIEFRTSRRISKSKEEALRPTETTIPTRGLLCSRPLKPSLKLMEVCACSKKSMFQGQGAHF